MEETKTTLETTPETTPETKQLYNDFLVEKLNYSVKIGNQYIQLLMNLSEDIHNNGDLVNGKNIHNIIYESAFSWPRRLEWDSSKDYVINTYKALEED